MRKLLCLVLLVSSLTAQARDSFSQGLLFLGGAAGYGYALNRTARTALPKELEVFRRDDVDRVVALDNSCGIVSHVSLFGSLHGHFAFFVLHNETKKDMKVKFTRTRFIYDDKLTRFPYYGTSSNPYVQIPKKEYVYYYQALPNKFDLQKKKKLDVTLEFWDDTVEKKCEAKLTFHRNPKVKIEEGDNVPEEFQSATVFDFFFDFGATIAGSGKNGDLMGTGGLSIGVGIDAFPKLNHGFSLNFQADYYEGKKKLLNSYYDESNPTLSRGLWGFGYVYRHLIDYRSNLKAYITPLWGELRANYNDTSDRDDLASIKAVNLKLMYNYSLNRIDHGPQKRESGFGIGISHTNVYDAHVGDEYTGGDTQILLRWWGGR